MASSNAGSVVKSNASTTSGSSVRSFDLHPRLPSSAASPRLIARNGQLADGAALDDAAVHTLPQKTLSMKDKISRMFASSRESSDISRRSQASSPSNGSQSPFVKPSVPQVLPPMSSPLPPSCLQQQQQHQQPLPPAQQSHTSLQHQKPLPTPRSDPGPPPSSTSSSFQTTVPAAPTPATASSPAPQGTNNHIATTNNTHSRTVGVQHTILPVAGGAGPGVATSVSAPSRGSSTKRLPPHQQQRFVHDKELTGAHEHHLKSSKRQEKLSDMWRHFIGRKQDNGEHHNIHDLSLVSGWVDSLRRENQKEDAHHEKKVVTNASATLVEKYGKCHEVVGRGAFGVVRISHKRGENGTEKLYAVKELRRRPEETAKKYSKRLTAEFCISSSLRHPNVIHTLDLLQDAKGDYCEVMEFCPGGDLYTLVLSATKLEVQEADCFFKQMMRGVEYMHEMGVAHRDLKPENLLLTHNGGLKITDFGNGECFRMAWENSAHMVSGLCGSAPYIAPEEYVDREFDARAVDVWACGVIYMAMRTGRHLWRVARKAEDEFYSRYLEGRRGEEGYGPIEVLHRARCRNVVYSILDPNPSRRLTASQILRSEWVREIQLCKAGEEGL